MSKSLGNFYTLRDLLEKGYDPKSIRYVLLATHYRQKLNFTFEGLDAAKSSVNRLLEFIRNLKSVKDGKNNPAVSGIIEKVKKEFEKEMDDDLNISNALAAIFNFVRDINKIEISEKDALKVIEVMKGFDSVLGVMEEKDQSIDSEIEALIEERNKARKEKDFDKADSIRDQLKEKGIILDDTPKGTIWKKI
jgi:cysteinyl-tRNA synthetase